MAMQNIFSNNYAEKLLLDVEKNIDKYKGDFFSCEETKLGYANIARPEGLLDKMLQTTNDCEAAITLYEAYKDLSPLQASQESFWIYLTHVDLFQYVKKRWNKEITVNYVQDHWFFRGKKHEMLRNALTELWWGVYLTVDNDNAADPYYFTKILFSNAQIIFRILPNTFARHKEAVFGVLQFIEDHKELKSRNSTDDRASFAAQYIKQLGGAKQLAILNRKDIYNALEEVKYDYLNFKRKDEKEKNK